jgi:hypothetical protein
VETTNAWSRRSPQQPSSWQQLHAVQLAEVAEVAAGDARDDVVGGVPHDILLW